jgi:hypothetical protein
MNFFIFLLNWENRIAENTRLVNKIWARNWKTPNSRHRKFPQNPQLSGKGLLRFFHHRPIMSLSAIWGGG